ncbi:hypothetical protein ACIP88_04910 [Streptomyces uncialis]|uniref:hypothetical protein n=1 Tax=Streptomyces uncialis TaxID=1048205 RepID=UPI003826D3E0
MTYDFVRYMDDIAAWYQDVLTTHYPDGPDKDAKEAILACRDQFARLASEDPSPAAGAASVQWARVVVMLADAEQELGRPGWRPEWMDVYEHFVLGDDEVFGPFGPNGS